MFKKISILLILFSLCACKPAVAGDAKNYDWQIITPSGAPALSLLDCIGKDNVQIEVVNGSDALSSEFVNNEKDIIIAPINLGINLAAKDDNYRLLAVITWGNLYLVSVDEDTDLTNTVAFGENAVPGKIINYLSNDFRRINFEYLDSVQDAGQALLSGEYDSAILAEPVLSNVSQVYADNHDGKELTVRYNLQELYKNRTGLNNYPQAAILVKKERMEKDMTSFVSFTNTIKQSISNYNNSNEALSSRIAEINLADLGFKDADELVKSTYAKMALDYVPASECLNEIRTFLALFDMTLDEKIYIK